MVVAPYGEARRLAYFRIICEQGEKILPSDISVLAEQVLNESKKMALALRKYKRTTGKMESKNVCYNYLRFCSWLELLKIEGPLVSKNSYTVFFSTIEPGDGFNLSKNEKLGYFVHLWSHIPELTSSLHLLSTSRPTPSGKLVRSEVSEHHAETYVEWFVDLELASPTRQQFGGFFLSKTGSIVNSADSFEKACCSFASSILEHGVELNGEVSLDYVWEEMLSLSEMLSPHIRNPVDRNLVAVLPVLLHLQVRLVLVKHTFIPFDGIVSLAKRATEMHSATFTWDSAYKSGFLRFGEKHAE
jgi:hypothetical protein